MRQKGFACVLVSLLIFLSVALVTRPLAPVRIVLTSGTTYQTISGWEAETQAGQEGCPGFDQYQGTLFDQAVNDLGINRLRLGIRSGVENSRDYWTEFQAGVITHETWRSVRYATTNDNDDPFTINWAGFHFTDLDRNVEQVVLPMKQRLEARGERLFINLCYTAFTAQIGAGLRYDHDDPEEYAELVLATYLHLQGKYGWVPDTWEVILEPDNVAQWANGTVIGNAIATAGRRLEANGFTPRFVAPSTTHMGRAVAYLDAMAGVPRALDYLEELSYHRYDGVSAENLAAIAERAVRYGLNTSMLEHIGSDYEDLHQDLKLGRNAAWQQFTLAYCAEDNGAQYYTVGSQSSNNPVVTMASRTRFLRQYFKFVRAGAVRIGASSDNGTFDPLAFVNADGKQVVVVKAAGGGAFTVEGLPAGVYGIKYTTYGVYDVDLEDVVVEGTGVLATSIPERGVLTVYAKASTPPVSPTGSVTRTGTAAVTASPMTTPAVTPTGALTDVPSTVTATPTTALIPVTATPTKAPCMISLPLVGAITVGGLLQLYRQVNR